MIMATLIKGLVYSFKGLVHYHQYTEHGVMQADMVLGKELRVLHLDLKATGSELCATLGIS